MHSQAVNNQNQVQAGRAFFSFVIFISFIGLSACSTASWRHNPKSEQSLVAGAPATPAALPTDPGIQAIPTGKSPDIDSSGSDLAAIPIEVNRLVLQWIDYFQGRGREHMERYLARSSRYLPKMKEVFRKKGLPEDLIYIALIESGFSSSAKSTANAVGYWQFIRGTGRHYGLQIDNYVDERRDFIRSTEAAADYFSGLYNLFGSWYLAIASYNVGENRVKNVVMKYHTRDFWALAREGKLPQETIHYIPKFTAARLIARDPEKYGFTNIDYQAPLDYSEVEINHAVDLRQMAKEMDFDEDEFRSLNPSYKKGVALEKHGKVTLRIPTGTQEKAMAAAEKSQVTNRAAYAKVASDDDVTFYKIRNGDTLASIARRFGTSPRKIRKLNRLSLRSSLVAGRKIKVPGDSIAGLARRKLAADEQTSERSREQFSRQSKEKIRMIAGRSKVALKKNSQAHDRKIHIVRRGDTLIEIARRYDIPLTVLTNHNRLSRRTKLVVGTRLAIPD